MTKASAIFQEIENRLAKDHYASTLPVYHPAKGRRKRMAKETPGHSDKSPTDAEEAHSLLMQFEEYEEVNPLTPFPKAPPEIQEPGETEIEPPREREIDPDRDLPHRDLPHPDEEEMPGEVPDPEVEDPGQVV